MKGCRRGLWLEPDPYPAEWMDCWSAAPVAGRRMVVVVAALEIFVTSNRSHQILPTSSRQRAKRMEG